MEFGRRKSGRPRKVTSSNDSKLRSDDNTSAPTFDGMDIQPTISPTTAQPAGTSNFSPTMESANVNSPNTLAHPATNRRKRNTGNSDMACSPRRRGRPRRSTSADNLASTACVPQVVSRSDNSTAMMNPTSGTGYTAEATHGQSHATAMMNPTSDSGDVEMSYRQRGRPSKATISGNSNINLTTPSHTVLSFRNKNEGGAYTSSSESTHEHSPASPITNPVSTVHDQSPANPIMNLASNTGDVELSYRRKGRPRKARNSENSNNITTSTPTVLRCENTTRGPATESLDNTQTSSNPFPIRGDVQHHQVVRLIYVAGLHYQAYPP